MHTLTVADPPPVRPTVPLSERRPRSGGDELSLLAALIEAPECARFVPATWFHRRVPRLVYDRLVTPGPRRAALFVAAAASGASGMWWALADAAHRDYQAARHDAERARLHSGEVAVLTRLHRAVSELHELGEYGRRVVEGLRVRHAAELANGAGGGDDA